MRLPNLSKIFPPSKYLEPLVLGLDISDRSLKFVELSFRKGRPVLGKFGQKVLPEGLIQSGEIKNRDALIDFLKSGLSEFSGREIILALPEEKAFLGLVTLPLMSQANIREALELQLEEHVPLSPSEAVFDYELLPAEEKQDHLDVIIVAFPRNLVEGYRDAVKAAGLKPAVFEMETQALVRSVLPPDEEGVVMVVDFGRTRTSFAIVSQGIIRFTSTVSLAGADLDKALVQTFKIELFAAERMKKERGLVRTKENQEVFNALLPVVSAICDEISRHLLFWQGHAVHAHSSKPEVAKLYLCGGESNLIGLGEYLAYDLKLPVVLANPWVNIASFEDYVPEITYNESLSYATALGLALRSVNLPT